MTEPSVENGADLRVDTMLHVVIRDAGGEIVADFDEVSLGRNLGYPIVNRLLDSAGFEPASVDVTSPFILRTRRKGS